MIAAVAVLGATPLGRALALHLDAAGALAALWDTEPAALAGSSWPTAADLDAVLANPEIDAVALTGPVDGRRTLAEAALTAGKHVLVPGCLSGDATAGPALVAMAEAAGVRLVIAGPTRWRPAVRALVALAKLGPVRRVHLARRARGPADPAADLGLLAELLGGADTVQVLHDTAHVIAGDARGLVAAVGAHPEPGLQIEVLGEGGAVRLDGDLVTTYQGAAAPTTQTYPGDGVEALCQAFLAGAAASADDAALRAAARASAGSGRAEPLAPRTWFAHPTVEIDGAVTIGEGTRVWHFSKLLGPLTIGARCSLGQNVVVERGVVLGDNVKVQNNVSIYSGVILEDDVFCGPSMVFTNVGTPRSHFPRRGEYLVTRCKRGASIGANATIVCGNTLGQYCFVGAGAVVTKDVPDFALVYGNPARVRAWACYCGVTLALGTDAEGAEDAECPECGRRYHREGHDVQMTEA